MNKRNIAIFVGMAIAGAIAGSTLGVPGGVSAQSQAISVGIKNTGESHRQHGPGKNAEEIASILNLTKEELRTQVRSGKTLAQIATTQKVDINLVINAIVASIKTHIAEEVSSGEITQAIADKKLANVTTKVTEMVNNLPPARGERGSTTHTARGERGSKTHNKNYGESTETQKTGA